jgi:hypothetical protein
VSELCQFEKKSIFATLKSYGRQASRGIPGKKRVTGDEGRCRPGQPPAGRRKTRAILSKTTAILLKTGPILDKTTAILSKKAPIYSIENKSVLL